GFKLGPKVGRFAAAALAVLAGTVFTLVERAFWTAPEILAEPAVDFVLGADALGHLSAPDMKEWSTPSFAESLLTDGKSRHGHAKRRQTPPANTHNAQQGPKQALIVCAGRREAQVPDRTPGTSF